jgi:hypothetical protein
MITGYFTIDGQRQNGVILRRLDGRVGHQKKRIKYWGVPGEYELRGEKDGREISIKMVVADAAYTTYAKLATRLQLWDGWRGLLHGTLVVNDTNSNVGKTYKNVTFEGYEALDDETAGPLPDVSGTLTGTVNTWFQIVVFKFYQLHNV